MSEEANRLQEEGDALFREKRWADAMGKYDAAIELDGGNAIVYAYKAACAVPMKKYLNAAEDAETATKLDPKYTKAWVLLAQAEERLSHWSDCFKAWDSALDSLPSTDLSFIQHQQKDKILAGKDLSKLLQYEEDVRLKNWPDPQKNVTRIDMPHNRAVPVVNAFVAAGKGQTHSSAWVLDGLSREILQGMERLKMLRSAPEYGPRAIYGSTECMACFTNAIVRDVRAWYSIPSLLLDKIQMQAIFERDESDGWGSGSADTIAKQAKTQLKSSSWISLRPRLTVTMRGYIFRAAGAVEGRGNLPTALAFYDAVLDLINWGRDMPLGLDVELRGAVFTQSFRRGVKTLRLDAFLKANMVHPDDYAMEDLERMANDILEDTKSEPRMRGVDHGFILSFWVYPLARAYAALGYVNCKKAEQSDEIKDDVTYTWTRGAQEYLKAAAQLPMDDELKLTYLNEAFKAFSHDQAPLKTTLPIMKTMKNALPKAKKIWEHSLAAMEGGFTAIEETLRFCEEVSQKLEEGTVTLDSIVKPSWM